MSNIEVGGIEIEVTRKRIKNLHLAVYPPDGRVTVACPESTNPETIRLYLISKLGWIKRQQNLLKSKERQSARKYVSRETHYFFGKAYLLNVVHTQGKHGVFLKDKSTIELHVQEGTSTENRAALINAFYREQLKQLLPLLIEKWSTRIDVTPQNWTIKLMKTKWGSCNTNKATLLFNLELAKKPKSCIEYIVVHELVHLLERTHNDRFTQYMDRYMPHWRRHRDELNNLPVSHVEWGY